MTVKFPTDTMVFSKFGMSAAFGPINRSVFMLIDLGNRASQ